MLATIGFALSLLGPKAPGTMAVHALPVQGPTRFRGPNNEIEIWPFRRISVSVFGAGSFSVEGDPATIQWKDAGLAFSANSMNGELGVETGRGYFVKSAIFQGQAVISYDTDRVAAFMSGPGGSPPPQAEGVMKMTLEAAALGYTGDFDAGVIQLSSPFQFTGSTKVNGAGSTGAAVLTDTMSLSGTSGKIGVVTHVAAGGMPFRTGNVLGPVNFHYQREPGAGGQPGDSLEVTGVADRLDFDFVSDTHTVTLTGNVRVEGMRGAYQGSTSGDRAVLTFGAKNELVNITVEGNPSESNLKPRPKPGGGR